MKQKERKRTVKKTAKESAKPQLVPQPNGRGALLAGGLPGNAGGGRPKDVVRQKLALLAQGKGISFLDNTLAGKIEVQLVGKCASCGKEGEMPKHLRDFFSGIVENIQTTVDQRLKANEQALKYGVGTKDELPDVKDDPRVVAFVEKVKAVIKRNTGTAVYDTIIRELAIEVVND